MLKEDRFKTQEQLAEHLGVSIWSLMRWKNVYTTSGLDKMITISNGGKRREVVTLNIHLGLKNKLQDSNNPLLGYNDAIEWVKNNYGITLKYHTLRSYMKRHFKTKLKIPRKSHYKKDDEAIELFKKPSKCLRGN